MVLTSALVNNKILLWRREGRFEGLLKIPKGGKSQAEPELTQKQVIHT